MPYFKDDSNGLHFLTEDDVADGFKSLLPDSAKEITEAEALSIEQPAISKRDVALAKIVDLEAGITPRRLREAVLGIDGGWLQGVNDEIANLRKEVGA